MERRPIGKHAEEPCWLRRVLIAAILSFEFCCFMWYLSLCLGVSYPVVIVDCVVIFVGKRAILVLQPNYVESQ